MFYLYLINLKFAFVFYFLALQFLIAIQVLQAELQDCPRYFTVKPQFNRNPNGRGHIFEYFNFQGEYQPFLKLGGQIYEYGKLQGGK